MKQLSNKEYEAYEQYKIDRLHAAVQAWKCGYVSCENRGNRTI